MLAGAYELLAMIPLALMNWIGVMITCAGHWW